MNRVREFPRSRKAYITAAIGLAGAVIAWADGDINGVALLAAQACFIRAGISTEVQKGRQEA